MFEKYAISISKLDELSLYLEIAKFEKILSDLKQEAVMMPNINYNQIQLQSKMPKVKKIIQLHKNELKKYGINPKDEDAVYRWKVACQKYLDNLDMVEYAIFLQMRASCQPLDKFYSNKTDGNSSFLENEKNKQQKKIKAMKIS